MTWDVDVKVVLPVKQGLKPWILWMHIEETAKVKVVLPVKQGLKLKKRSNELKMRVVKVVLPVKQGLKQYAFAAFQ